ncbi:NUDIX hydrolase [candidate division KSB1 bacterium]|nr:NUDIX hydrolase [candidate division KSB1 bacterium]
MGFFIFRILINSNPAIPNGIYETHCRSNFSNHIFYCIPYHKTLLGNPKAKNRWSVNCCLVSRTILLVQNSYHGYYSLPGGYLKRKESAVNAVIRELRKKLELWLNLVN